MNNAPDGERDSAAVQEFLGNMETAFRAHTLWAGCSEEELESAGEVSLIFLHCFGLCLFFRLHLFRIYLLKKGRKTDTGTYSLILV